MNIALEATKKQTGSVDGHWQKRLAQYIQPTVLRLLEKAVHVFTSVNAGASEFSFQPFQAAMTFECHTNGISAMKIVQDYTYRSDWSSDVTNRIVSAIPVTVYSTLELARALVDPRVLAMRKCFSGCLQIIRMCVTGAIMLG